MASFSARHIIEEVAALAPPNPEAIVITHGAALVTWGIRAEHDTGDIDIVTTLENNQYFENVLGFEQVPMVVGVNSRGQEVTLIARCDVKRRFESHLWDFSRYRYNRTGEGKIQLAELLSMSEQDKKTGIWVATPELVLLTKLETGRTSDIEDVGRIERYLEQGH